MKHGWVTMMENDGGGAIFANGEKEIRVFRVSRLEWAAETLSIRGRVRVYSRDRVGAIEKALLALKVCGQLDWVM